MQTFTGERVLMRIHIGERDKWDGEPLYQAITQMLRAKHYAGCTVVRAIMGFGASSKMHSDRFEVMSLDLPIVLECVETEEKIDAMLAEKASLAGAVIDGAEMLLTEMSNEQLLDFVKLDVHKALDT